MTTTHSLLNLSMLCAGSIGCATVGAQTSTQIYGQLGASVNTRSGVSTLATTDLADNQIATSYFGFRGSEDLGGDMRAIYRLESAVALDTGNIGATVAGNNKFFNRQSFVGLDFGKAGVVTLGRQFHAATDRTIRTLDVYNAGGTLAVTPIGLFGVNRFVGNDSRADNSIKYRVSGPAGLEGAVSYGISEDTVGKSYSADLAKLDASYEVAAYAVKFIAPTLVAGTGARPQHQVWGFGGNLPMGHVKLYANYFNSKLDATVAGRGTQVNKVTTVGLAWTPSTTVYKLAYYNDQGSMLNGIGGRDGKKITLVASAEYFLSKRTSLYGAFVENRYTDGYKLESVNLAALGRDPTASAVRMLSVGVRHTF